MLILEQIRKFFTSSLDKAANTRTCFILQESKETKLDFSQRTLNYKYVIE